MRLHVYVFKLWLIDGFIKGSCGFMDVPAIPMVIYEDNPTCIALMKVAT